MSTTGKIKEPRRYIGFWHKSSRSTNRHSWDDSKEPDQILKWLEHVIWNLIWAVVTDWERISRASQYLCLWTGHQKWLEKQGFHFPAPPLNEQSESWRQSPRLIATKQFLGTSVRAWRWRDTTTPRNYLPGGALPSRFDWSTKLATTRQFTISTDGGWTSPLPETMVPVNGSSQRPNFTLNPILGPRRPKMRRILELCWEKLSQAKPWTWQSTQGDRNLSRMTVTKLTPWLSEQFLELHHQTVHEECVAERPAT